VPNQSITVCLLLPTDSMWTMKGRKNIKKHFSSMVELISVCLVSDMMSSDCDNKKMCEVSYCRLEAMCMGLQCWPSFL